jgi:hypothetical protein
MRDLTFLKRQGVTQDAKAPEKKMFGREIGKPRPSSTSRRPLSLGGAFHEGAATTMTRKLTATVLLVVFALTPALAVNSKKAEYVGGTVTSIPEKTEGTFDTKNDTAIVFTPKKGAPLTIPYASISEIEYGQKAGRRVGVAILVSPLALFSKKRKHFLTLTYTDAAGTDQAAVFELGKDIIRTSLTIVETRSGKEIEFQDDEARKAGRGGN